MTDFEGLTIKPSWNWEDNNKEFLCITQYSQTQLCFT